jgi:DNA-binding Lrp family transcriptional regulator/YHS domain-containing protein
MRGLDDTDREILDILRSDGRRPYSDIAEAVDLSPPAVSDRIDRLQEIGVVRRFTVDLDRSVLREGVPVLVDLQVRPGRAGGVSEALSDAESVEHVFTTADERVVATATVPDGDVSGLLAETVEPDALDGYEVDLLADTAWSPSMPDAEFAPDCAECGNTVDAEGETTELDGTTYHFCCSSCQSRFVDHYEELLEGTESTPG